MKVFISFDYDRNKKHKEHISKLLKIIRERKRDIEDISIDEQNKVDDEGKSDEEVRQIIRDNYLKDSDVTIVIVGGDTRNRKFIDWEIYTTIKEYNQGPDKSPNGGIVVVNCCYNKQGKIDSWILDKELVMAYDGSLGRKWNESRKDLIKDFSFLPERLLKSMTLNYDYDKNINLDSNKPTESVFDYPHAVFPIIGFDKLLDEQKGWNILWLAIRQANMYRGVNTDRKWDLSKLRRKNNEDPTRFIYKEIEAR